MNYQTRWRIRIAGRVGFSQSDLQFSYWLELPFVPVVGMEVSIRDWSASAEKVWFDADNNLFHCFVAPLRFHPEENDEREAERESLLKAGWTQDE